MEEGVHVHAAAQARSVDGAALWQPADDALLGRLVFPLSAAALEDPLQDAGVFTEAWPEEGAAGRVLSEPVDVEDLWQLSGGFSALHAQPVSEVVAKVVPEEGPHGEGVVHEDFACAQTLHGLNVCLIQHTATPKPVKFTTTVPLCSAAAVASDLIAAPTNTPCFQLKDS